jgi:hypothetical protein
MYIGSMTDYKAAKPCLCPPLMPARFYLASGPVRDRYRPAGHDSQA